MMALDRDAVLCDLAETYGIFDWKGLPAATLAALCVGLREDSRIKMKLSGETLPRRDLLLAAAVDRLSMMVWMQSTDGKNGVNRPPSLVKALTGNREEASPDKPLAFDSPAEFEAAWSEITGVRHG
jgi:hypothetical protein